MIAALPDNFAQLLLGASVAAGSVLIAVSSLREVVRRHRAEESFLKQLADSMRKNFAQDKEILEHAKEGELTEKEKVGLRETIYEVLPKLNETDKASIERALKQPSPRGRENYEIKILSESAHRALKRLETSDAVNDAAQQAQDVAGQATDEEGQAVHQVRDEQGHIVTILRTDAEGNVVGRVDRVYDSQGNLLAEKHVPEPTIGEEHGEEGIVVHSWEGFGQFTRKVGGQADETVFPIEGYDEMNVAEVSERLNNLSAEELQLVRDYEERNKRRDTLLEQMDRKIRAT
jgi:hypothetical protein